MRACALLCIRNPNRHVLVTVRTLTLTSPGPPSSSGTNPSMHRSTSVVLVPSTAMIFVTRFIIEVTFDLSPARSSDRTPLALRTVHTRVLCGLCSSSCIPCYLSDPMMKSQCVMSGAHADEIDAVVDDRVPLLLLSDPDELGCSVLFSSALSSLTTTTSLIAAACSSHILRRSCPEFSRHVARAGVLVSACGDAGLRT